MKRLTIEQVKRLHRMQIESTGGSDGIRDEGLLESALNSAFHSFEGADLYPTPISKIARIAYGLISNHPFIDGNKRIGTYVMLILLELNYFEISFTDDDITRIGLGVASGQMSEADLLNLLLEQCNLGE